MGAMGSQWLGEGETVLFVLKVLRVPNFGFSEKTTKSTFQNMFKF